MQQLDYSKIANLLLSKNNKSIALGNELFKRIDEPDSLKNFLEILIEECYSRIEKVIHLLSDVCVRINFIDFTIRISFPDYSSRKKGYLSFIETSSRIRIEFEFWALRIQDNSSLRLKMMAILIKSNHTASCQ